MPEEKKEEKKVEKEERKEEREKEVIEKEVKEVKEAKAKTTFEILLHKKPAVLLTLLLQDRQWYPSALARESAQSYVYATEIVKRFEKDGLIVCSRKGKRRIVKLTEKGDKIARLINEVASALTIQPPAKESK